MRYMPFFKNHKKLIVLSIILAFAGLCGLGYYYNSTNNTQQDWSPITKAPDIIQGKVVTLKLLKESYFIDFHNMFSQDVRHNFEYPEFITLEWTIRWLKSEMEKSAKGQQLMYCIFNAKEDKLIGALEIREKNDKDPGQFGCWINERFRGGGRIQEAIKLISNIYFRLTNAQEFTAHVRLWNKRSYRALMKAGFTDTKKFYLENGKPTRYLLEFYRPQK